jgi:hypothetical protein
VKVFLWVVAAIGALAGSLFVIGAFFEDSAPKQAASAAVGLGLAVIPYCLARSCDEYNNETVRELKALNETMATHTRLLAEVANNAATPPAALVGAEIEDGGRIET